MNKPFKHHPFVKIAIEGGSSRARFNLIQERDLFFEELTRHYNLTPQLRLGVKRYIAILVPSNQKGRNNQGVARIVCNDGFVRGANGEPVNAFDVDINWISSYKEQEEVAQKFALNINAFTPKSLR